MAATVCPAPQFVGLDNSGNPLSAGKLYSYSAGTTTNLATYSDSTLETANANPVILDAGGRATVYLSASSYKFKLTSSGDDVIYTQDNVISSAPYDVDLDVPFIAGEAVTAGQAIYLSDGTGSRTAGRWYLTDSDTAAYSSLPITGFAVGAVDAGATGSVRLLGIASVPGTLSVGSTYYLAATAGAIASSAGTFSKVMGVADTASTLVMTVEQEISEVVNLLVTGTLRVNGVATFDVQPIMTSLTASQAVFTDGSKGLVSNAITGTGNVVMSASPTLTGTIGAAAMTLSTPLPVASGGTGIAAITANSLMLGAGTSDVTLLAPGSSSNVLTSNGTIWESSAPAATTEVGWGIAASVGSNALTVALTTKDGSTPSSGGPVSLDFRNVTPATGSLAVISVTAAETVVAPSGATLGAASGVAFRAWVVAFNDGGAVRLGLINCTSSTSIYPLGGWGIASSTTIGTGSDALQTFYSDSGVSAKAYLVIGYVSYESGLSTAGTWDVAPTRAQAATLDIPMPGDAVQQVVAEYATQKASTSSTYADTGLTADITPTSAANKVLVRATNMGIYKDSADQAIQVKLLRAATQIGLSTSGASGSTAVNAPGSAHWEILDSPATASSVTYKSQFAASGNTANVYIQQASSTSTIVLTEVMT